MLVPLLSLIACGVFALLWVDAERRLRSTLRWTRAVMDSAATTVTSPEPPLGLSRDDTLFWSWTATNARVQIKRLEALLIRERRLARTLLEDAERHELRQRGLADPDALRDSLVGHHELIPYGARFDFNDRRSIVILTPPYVFAPFDDGQTVGFALVRYHLDGGRVTWERLWSSLESRSTVPLE
jgi:hypothetical protein